MKNFFRIAGHPVEGEPSGCGPGGVPENTMARHSLSASPRAPVRQRGMALIWALGALLFVAGIIFASVDSESASRGMGQARFSTEGQARKLARAGLVDAYAWFRRQTIQPVPDFTPRLDLAASPPVNETDDPELGLVREFEVTPGIWGRYEVRKGAGPESFTDENGNGRYDDGELYVDADGDGSWSRGKDTRDVTVERGQPGKGVVWHIESMGTVYRRPRADLALGAGPNLRIGAARAACEIRRMTIAPPAEAAICAASGSKVTIFNRGRVRADETAIAVAEGTGSVTVYSGGELLAPTKSAYNPGYRSGIRDVFGVDLAQLKSMADVSTTATGDDLPSKIADYTLVVIEGDLTYDTTFALRGTGALVVNGDLTIRSGSNSFFTGVLFVTGNLRVEAPCFLRGTVIVNGRVELQGVGGDYVEVEHDPEVVSRLLTVMGQYRYGKATWVPPHTQRQELQHTGN